MAHEQTPWMAWAWSMLGIKELPGLRHTREIVDFHSETNLHATSDEVAWCSSFVNWCLARAGVEPTRSAAARSWLSWGVAASPEYGRILVFDRSSPDNPNAGHVGFYVGATNDGRVAVLGGNQGNAVSVMLYPSVRLLGIRSQR